MALIKCPECGGQISSFAKVCPHCGLPIKKVEINPLPKPKESKQAKEEVLSEAEQMRRERERLFAEERLRNRIRTTQQEESEQSPYMPKQSYTPRYTKPIIPKQTLSEDSEDQVSQGRQRSVFIVLWLLGMLGYFGYLAIDAIIPFIQHLDIYKEMGTEMVIIKLAAILIPLEMFIGSLKLLLWKRSGMESIVFGSVLLIGLVIYITVKFQASSLPSYMIRDIITAIVIPLATYRILQISTNGKSCWEWMD